MFFKQSDTILSGGEIGACWRSGNAGALQSIIHRFDSCTRLNFSPVPEHTFWDFSFPLPIFLHSAMLNVVSTRERMVVPIYALRSSRRDDVPQSWKTLAPLWTRQHSTLLILKGHKNHEKTRPILETRNLISVTKALQQGLYFYSFSVILHELTTSRISPNPLLPDPTVLEKSELHTSRLYLHYVRFDGILWL